MNPTTTVSLDHYYTFGDVYETLEACGQLEMLLGRLKRQRLITTEEWTHTKQDITDIRERVEKSLGDSPPHG